MSWLSRGKLGRAWQEVRRHDYQVAGDDEDFLLVTWDSCRYDAYQQARTPVLDRHAVVQKGWAMATYTLPAHQAMFSGFLPHVFEPLPFYNRYVQQLWRISHRNVHTKPLVTFTEGTETIVQGLRRRGYATIGVAAMEWFADRGSLQSGFGWFRVTGTKAREQIEMLLDQIVRRARRRPCFAFVNFGETHSPFRYAGMSTTEDDVDRKVSLSRLFNQRGVRDDGQTLDRALFARQVACAEYLDERMAKLLEYFQTRGRPTTVIVCADHGECLGEQGLYGHAFHHEKVMEVPILIFRLNAPPHAAPQPSIVAQKKCA